MDDLVLPASSDAYHKVVALRDSAPDGVWMPVWAALSKLDLYFLARYVLSSGLAPYLKSGHPWVFERCREVQASPNGHLDIWAREHYKSTIITFALTIFDLLNDPEKTFGIFSHTRPIAKGFLRNIKIEFESNELLKNLHSGVCWREPHKEAPKWSEDEGIILRRVSNRREASIEAWGLVDGQPTSKHFDVRVYDDVVTDKSITSPEMVEKTTQAWELSGNLGTETGVERYIGTRYHLRDTYAMMLERKAAQPRIYPCYSNIEAMKDDDEVKGEPVLYSEAYLDKKRRDQGPYTFAAQNLCDPTADDSQGFRRPWLKYYSRDPFAEGRNKNCYLFVDPANEKKRDSDYTVMAVIGLGGDRNYYLLDAVRDKLNLTERGDALFALHRDWRPLGVFYEKYGKDSDIQHLEFLMNLYGYRFGIEATGGIVRKEDRIRRMIPIFEQGRFFIPPELRKRRGNQKVDLIEEFIQEFTTFPVGEHDDFLDTISRVADPEVFLVFPDADAKFLPAPGDYRPPTYQPETTWMAA